MLITQKPLSKREKSRASLGASSASATAFDVSVLQALVGLQGSTIQQCCDANFCVPGPTYNDLNSRQVSR